MGDTKEERLIEAASLIEGIKVKRPRNLRVVFEDGMAYGYSDDQETWIWMMPQEDYGHLLANLSDPR